uniref:Serpentine receptor class gamma n=1 Tax=Strongyloides papillosus TaxID=174720 RepID=A0A0N5BEJ7_STREA
MPFTISDYITCSIQIISLIAYLLVIFLLISSIYHKTAGISTEFYIHFVANGVVDILSNVLDICIRRFLTWGCFLEFYHSYLWIGTISPIVYYSTMGNCAVGILIITLNRFLQMNFPLFYKSFWNKKVTIIMIFFQIITPYISYIYLVNFKVTLVYSEERDYFYHSMKDQKASWLNSLVMCIWSGSTFIISFVMNILNIRKYKEIMDKKKKSGSPTSKVYVYSFYCCIISTSLLMVFINSSIKLYAVEFANKSLKELANFNFEWIILLMTCSHPFLIIILSRDIREKLLKFYTLNQLSKIRVIPMYVAVVTKSNVARH